MAKSTTGFGHTTCGTGMAPFGIAMASHAMGSGSVGNAFDGPVQRHDDRAPRLPVVQVQVQVQVRVQVVVVVVVVVVLLLLHKPKSRSTFDAIPHLISKLSGGQYNTV